MVYARTDDEQYVRDGGTLVPLEQPVYELRPDKREREQKERNAIFNMITNGEYEIDRVLCIPPNQGKGAPCGACRELMTQLMPGKYQDIDIMIDYAAGRVMKLGELTPEWWID